ncbi:MAG: type II toxin-antitoxin system VapB family antitoxin [Lachnospiraceae bacterium]|nr:type II toxin-antitoxin system VapB family antitoxin [Lachnospiraceae bacterium]
MDTAKVFTNGGSQAVRLPKNYRFDTSEVYVNQIGNVVLLIPTNDRWQSLLTSLSLFTEDFLSEPIKALAPGEEVTLDDEAQNSHTQNKA